MKSEYAKLPGSMALRSCRVSISDLNGVRHTTEVTASTLYEAVALGLAAIRRHDWGEIPEGLNMLDVSVSEVAVTHSVRLRDFKSWVNRTGGAPRDVLLRNRIREISDCLRKATSDSAIQQGWRFVVARLR